MTDTIHHPTCEEYITYGFVSEPGRVAGFCGQPAVEKHPSAGWRCQRHLDVIRRAEMEMNTLINQPNLTEVLSQIHTEVIHMDLPETDSFSFMVTGKTIPEARSKAKELLLGINAIGAVWDVRISYEPEVRNFHDQSIVSWEAYVSATITWRDND